jgi:hypothetical protein
VIALHAADDGADQTGCALGIGILRETDGDCGQQQCHNQTEGSKSLHKNSFKNHDSCPDTVNPCNYMG